MSSSGSLNKDSANAYRQDIVSGKITRVHSEETGESPSPVEQIHTTPQETDKTKTSSTFENPIDSAHTSENEIVPRSHYDVVHTQSTDGATESNGTESLGRDLMEKAESISNGSTVTTSRPAQPTLKSICSCCNRSYPTWIDARFVHDGVPASAKAQDMRLAKMHFHSRDADIAFDDVPHLYYYRGDDCMTSVTTFISRFFPIFDPDRAISCVLKSRKWQQGIHKYSGMTPDEIKESWVKTGKEASALGTRMHENIELFYNGHPVDDNSVEYGYFRKYHAEHVEKNGWIPFRTEWIIYDCDLLISGQIDMLYYFMDKGVMKFIIVDWKRTKDLPESNSFDHMAPPLAHLEAVKLEKYYLQLTLYKHILEKNYGLRIADMYLAVFHPINDNYRLIRVPNREQEIKTLVRARMDELSGVDAKASGASESAAKVDNESTNRPKHGHGLIPSVATPAKRQRRLSDFFGTNCSKSELDVS